MNGAQYIFRPYGCSQWNIAFMIKLQLLFHISSDPMMLPLFKGSLPPSKGARGMSAAHQYIQRSAHRTRHHPSFVIISVFTNNIDAARGTNNNFRMCGMET